jgi:hypothetical protein
LSFGYRRQLPRNTSIDVGFIGREYRDRTALVEQNGIYDGVSFRGYGNPALNQIYLLTNNRWNWPVYKAIEMVVTKQAAGFQLLASYTHVWPHLAGTWQPNDPASFIQPAVFPFSRGLDSNDNRASSPNSAFDAATRASGAEWTQNVGRANVVYQLPWQFMLSGSYTVQRGRWSGPILTRIGAPEPQFGSTTLTLANGRIVSNPLATAIRFAYTTRSEGQFELPTLQYVNVRVGRQFHRHTYTVALNLDVLNLPNLGKYQGFLSGANQIYSANYGLGGEVQPPRSVQLELRFLF